MGISIKYIKENRKDFTEFYTKNFSKYFSPYLTLISVRLGITPNGLTYIMWIIGILAACTFLYENIYISVIGGILLITINILDTSDGEVARITGQTSDFGVALDKIAHFTTNIVLIYFIALSLSNFYESWIPIHLSICLILFICADEMIKELFLSQKLKKDMSSSKIDISYNRSSKAEFIVHISAGCVGLYHILPLLMFIDWSFDIGRLSQSIYLSYFLLVNTLKSIVRFFSVRKGLS
tara:strand:+ start:2922 stop:3635 length:714 start_codon:yes stop_codon:yes gene_type:complete